MRSISVRKALENPGLEPGVVFDTDPLPQTFPEISHGQFWRDGDVGYLVSGVTESQDISFPNWTLPESNKLWQYNLTGADSRSGYSWYYKDLPEVRRAYFQGGVFVPWLRQGFLLGGVTNKMTGPETAGQGEVDLAGLVTFDAEKSTWTNETTPASFPFSAIDIYDIDSKKWYTQFATGAITDLRRDFCGVVVSSSDGKSHQIYIFGGASRDLYTQKFSDVNILSIPSFEWVSTDPSGDRKPGLRRTSTCHLYGKRHMVVYGGVPDNNTCDATNDGPSTFGVFLYDLTKLAWVDGYPGDTDSEYVAPKAVEALIGSGNSTKVAPDTGFANDELNAVFNTTPTPTSQTTSTSEATSSPSGASGAHIGDIVGGVIGAVAILALGIVGFLFLRRRKAQQVLATAEYEKKAQDSLHQHRELDGTSIHRSDEVLTHELDSLVAHEKHKPTELPSYQPVELPTNTTAGNSS